jgi:hypothetical protein
MQPATLTNRLRLLALPLMLVTAPVVAVGQFTFSTNNGALTVTGYTGPGGAVVIPNTTNGLQVTSIGDHSFESKSGLTGISIPDSVTNIGNFAFYYCANLTMVALGNGVVTVGDQAFSRCARMVDFTFPNTTRRIGVAAFTACISLTNLTIPANVTGIGLQAFYYCTSLRAISVEPLNLAYSSLDGVLFNYDRTSLLQFPGGKTGSYTIPATVSNIDLAAFMQCSKLSGITIPGSVTNIADYAFYWCIGLSNLTIPEGVTSIGLLAFSGCTSATNFTIPASVSSIGHEALTYCIGLPAFTVADANLNYSSVAGVLLNKDQTLLIQCPGAKVGVYSIPNTVFRIGISAFYGCRLLTEILIPDSVSSIGGLAFYSCSGLRELTIPAAVTNIEQEAFDACANLTSVYFKGDAPVAGYQPFYYVTNATVYYLPGTVGWGPIWGGVPTMLWHPRILTERASFGVLTNQFGFEVNWASGKKIVLEACSDPAHPSWSPVLTNTLPADFVYLSDPAWTNYPARFYRIRSR